MLRQRADGVVTAYQFLTCRIFIDGVMLPVRAAKEADFNRNLPLACMPRDASRTYATWLWPRNCSILRAIVQQSGPKLAQANVQAALLKTS